MALLSFSLPATGVFAGVVVVVGDGRVYPGILNWIMPAARKRRLFVLHLLFVYL